MRKKITPEQLANFPSRIKRLSSRPHIVALPKPLSDVELAYLAGFFDADGSIGAYATGGKKVALRCMVVGLDELSVSLFKEAFSGHIYCREHGAATSDGVKRRPLWSWTASGNLALAFLRRVEPFLHLKRPQAQLALTFPVGTTGGRGHLAEDQRALRLSVVEGLKELKRNVR